jgi:hypothetical protein
MNWVKKAHQPVFTRSCDQGCDAEVATACDSGCDASPCGHTHPAAQPKFNYVAPESSRKPAHAPEATPGDLPADMRPEPPVPPAPVAPDAAVPTETTDVSYGAFSWLKRSLNLD